MPKYVIIGNSAGGVGAVEGIRSVDREGSVAIISDEPYLAYSRPLISEYLSGETTLERMLYRGEDFYRRNAVETILGKKVVGVDIASSLVRLDDGQEVPYERLLVATGGVPFVPKMEGLDKDGVVTFTTLHDAESIASMLDGSANGATDATGRTNATAVVIGGGLIGVSVTEALTKRGVAVTIVELKDRILNVILDERGSAIAEAAVRAAGVKIVTNATVTRIVGKPGDDGKVGGVVLDNGVEIACDLVVAAIGVIPRVDAIADSAIARNRGVVVDRRMATNIPNVYACGDVAEAYDYVLDVNRLTPIWPNAYIGGRTAGLNMAGRDVLYPGGTGMNSLKYFGLAIVSAGSVIVEGQPEYEIVSVFKPETGVYKKVVLRDDVVVGFSFTNDIEKSGIISGLMRDKVDVASFKEALVADDFDFASLPKDMRQERLGIKRPQAEVTGAVEVEEERVEELILE